MSSDKASNSPGFYPVTGQKPSLDTQTRSRNEFSSLCLGVTKTSSTYPMLVVQPTSNSSLCILSRAPQVPQTLEQSCLLQFHGRSLYLVPQHVDRINLVSHEVLHHVPYKYLCIQYLVSECNIISAYWIMISWNSSTVMIHTDVLLHCKILEFTRGNIL